MESTQKEFQDFVNEHYNEYIESQYPLIRFLSHVDDDIEKTLKDFFELGFSCASVWYGKMLGVELCPKEDLVARKEIDELFKDL